MKNLLLEIACFDMASALVAQAAGASRIELCENYMAGGLTPSFEMLTLLRESLRIPVHVMVRPRPGNYCYLQHDLDEMYDDILVFKMMVEGIVVGALNSDKQVDVQVMSRIRKLAGPMSVTFHRAVDACPDMDRAVETLIDLGVDRVLTSGAKSSALEGASELKRLHEKFGHRITIIPAGGVRASVLPHLLDTGCTEFHSSAITVRGGNADQQEILAMKTLLKSRTTLQND